MRASLSADISAATHSFTMSNIDASATGATERARPLAGRRHIILHDYRTALDGREGLTETFDSRPDAGSGAEVEVTTWSRAWSIISPSANFSSTRFGCGAGRALETAENRIGRRLAAPVAAQQSAAVAQFRGDGPARQPQTKHRIEARAVLRGAQFDIAVSGAGRVTEKPASAAIPADRDLAPHQLVQRGCRHIHRTY